MIYLNSFLFAGLVCAIGQIILDNTKLTAGHITTMFTILGVVLSFLGFYDLLIKYCGMGAIVLITNFGHSLFSSGMEGFKEFGLLGIFKNLLTKSSLVISVTLICSLLFSFFFKSKD